VAATHDLPEVAYHFQLIQGLVDDNDPRVSQISLCHPSQMLQEAGPVDPEFADLLGGTAGVPGLVSMRNRQTLIGTIDSNSIDYTPFLEAIRSKLAGDDPARVHVCINWYRFRWVTRVPLSVIFDRPYDFWLPSRDDHDFVIPHRGIMSLDEMGNILWTPLTAS
jgi:hypothetical protein